MRVTTYVAIDQADTPEAAEAVLTAKAAAIGYVLSSPVEVRAVSDDVARSFGRSAPDGWEGGVVVVSGYASKACADEPAVTQ